jgi:hypothetical protein
VERNFRKLVKEYLNKLLEAKRTYWKQRSSIRWAKFGDENSKFFQLIATIAHRRNYISQLCSSDGFMVTDHDLKAGLLWSAFKERLGVTEFSTILF